MGKITNQQLDDAEKKNKQYRAMIMSMKPSERKNPDLLASQPFRRTRIAKGSGHTEAEVSTLVAQFAAMRKQVPSPLPASPPSLFAQSRQRSGLTAADGLPRRSPAPQLTRALGLYAVLVCMDPPSLPLHPPLLTWAGRRGVMRGDINRCRACQR
jgi:hypothetical protein